MTRPHFLDLCTFAVLAAMTFCIFLLLLLVSGMWGLAAAGSGLFICVANLLAVMLMPSTGPAICVATVSLAAYAAALGIIGPYAAPLAAVTATIVAFFGIPAATMTALHLEERQEE